MGSSVWGAITGGLFGLYDSYQEKRANDRAENLAKDQLEAEKRAQQNEDQARNKANQKQADLAAFLKVIQQAVLAIHRFRALKVLRSIRIGLARATRFWVPKHGSRRTA